MIDLSIRPFHKNFFCVLFKNGHFVNYLIYFQNKYKWIVFFLPNDFSAKQKTGAIQSADWPKALREETNERKEAKRGGGGRNEWSTDGGTNDKTKSVNDKAKALMAPPPPHGIPPFPFHWVTLSLSFKFFKLILLLFSQMLFSPSTVLLLLLIVLPFSLSFILIPQNVRQISPALSSRPFRRFGHFSVIAKRNPIVLSEFALSVCRPLSNWPFILSNFSPRRRGKSAKGEFDGWEKRGAEGGKAKGTLGKPSVVHYFCQRQTNDFFALWLDLQVISSVRFF